MHRSEVSVWHTNKNKSGKVGMSQIIKELRMMNALLKDL